MTLKEALVLSLEVWRYLAKHPDIEERRNMPEELYGKVEAMAYCEPLCEYYGPLSCDCCALFIRKGRLSCCEERHPYRKWKFACSREGRKEGATAIVRLLEAALEKENQNGNGN
jgi:hypothetical protein